jgi:hypothetical protein
MTESELISILQQHDPAAVALTCEELTVPEMQFGIAMQLKEIEALRKANAMLVSALDRIHDVLNEAYVDDVAFIVNQALSANKELRK